jgi:orotate phosphoribosyltransferase
VEGAFVAQMVAEELGTEFAYAEQVLEPADGGLYPVRYRIPAALRSTLQGKSVAIVNDVINAGSAVRGTFADLQTCGARPVAVGALMVLGAWTYEFVAEHRLGMETLATLPNEVWTPNDCPLCAAGTPLDRRHEG